MEMLKRILLLIVALACLAMCASCKRKDTTPDEPTTVNNQTPDPDPAEEADETDDLAEEADETDGVEEESETDTDETAIEEVVYMQLTEPKTGDPIAILKTSMGDITIRLFPEYAPKTVENFTTHAKNGYYDGVVFHRVIEDFMIQTGDPEGTGMGGESIWGGSFEDEVCVELHNIRGAVSMANSNNPQANRYNTNGSQFFIVQNTAIGESMKEEFSASIEDPEYKSIYSPEYNLSNNIPVPFLEYYIENGGTPHLDYPGINTGYKHSVFGQVIDGMDVVDAIASVNTDDYDRPLEEIIINTIEITEYQ